MKAEELDKIFDDGKEDILPYLDMSTLRRPNLNQKRVKCGFTNLDDPETRSSSQPHWRHATVHHQGLAQRENQRRIRRTIKGSRLSRENQRPSL